MRPILKLSILLLFIAIMASCGGKKEERSKLNDKKAELQKLKTEQQKLNEQINKLQDEIAVLDPTSVKAKLVTIATIGSEAFNHYIDLQGKIDAKNTAYVAPKIQGGIVRAVYVKQGDYVRKGQVILKLDDALLRQQLNSASQQAGTVRAQLNLAKTTLQRLQNLWANNIGTEMQVIQARSNVEALSSQLRAAEAQAAAAREQLSFTNVTSDISGTVDQVNVRVGEAFVGVLGTAPQISIVNTSVLKLRVQVPETYLDRVRQGTPLVITLPEANNRSINSTASVVSKLIDPVSRTFYVEGDVPSDPAIRANQIAKVQIRDYSRADAITIPVNTLQTDEKGKYVLVAVTENGKLVARKKAVIIGELYGDRLEVKSGLTNGDKIITEGFQNLYDGQIITAG